MKEQEYRLPSSVEKLMADYGEEPSTRLDALPYTRSISRVHGLLDKALDRLDEGLETDGVLFRNHGLEIRDLFFYVEALQRAADCLSTLREVQLEANKLRSDGEDEDWESEDEFEDIDEDYYDEEDEDAPA